MSYISSEEVFAYYDENGRLLCPECAASLLDFSSIGSDQILTMDEAEKEEGLYFCDEHPDRENDQII